MNYNDICVFDFETGSRNPPPTQPVQVAAVMIHGRKLTIQPDGYFESLINCFSHKSLYFPALFINSSCFPVSKIEPFSKRRILSAS